MQHRLSIQEYQQDQQSETAQEKNSAGYSGNSHENISRTRKEIVTARQVTL